MKILVCEEDEVLMTALSFRLNKQGFEVIRIKSGRQVVETLLKHEPSLLVFDLETPPIPFLELLRMIRSSVQPWLPIMLIAPLEEEEYIMEALGLGVTDFILKPFKPAELVIRIRRALQHRMAEK